MTELAIALEDALHSPFRRWVGLRSGGRVPG